MLRAMDSAVSGLRAHQNKLDVIGNNIANVNTFGFKSQSYSFKEAMYQTSTTSTKGSENAGGVNAAQYGYGSMMGSISTDMGASTPTYVGGLNASVDGEGFFITFPKSTETVAVADMKKTDFDYTRVGQFNIDGNGYLTDANGNFVYGFRPDNVAAPTKFDGALVAIKVPTDVDGASFDGNDSLQLTDVKINSLGEISGTVKSTDKDKDGKTVSIGKVAIATFQNPEGLSKKGSFYYGAAESDNSGNASATIPGGSTSSLMTGYLEASNVDLAKEFSDMITTQRGFQANSKIITVSDEILSDLINMKR
ncbi:flagellar hook-basal body complex protein [Clostridium sp. AF27-2AA]|uniref:flagellar hook-basal body complex protein n=1 Tax=Clostridium sp. AF27-2AA TaxID=2292206 RepID=UPI000E4C786B|nr:flagellar hook-basal body complex protein [Clostridium sp. AF27-2AA]RHQ31530.1 flagellar hook-basal body complex protein [Clostridium sp. AF27-2AA]